ncbi:DUF6597 domain-containing transcriptional factor [Polycladidibacter hongkongensis]|uniref:DUF6597 domain-containing transcriptional factor n=1 Tax=Polycladidibacter hongkongensis TaxID=1647556 RepID=UPI0008356BC9|nr:DUF6597 domain-containing transcriptional factor [Pseudovibrio hongkongensis]
MRAKLPVKGLIRAAEKPPLQLDLRPAQGRFGAGVAAIWQVTWALPEGQSHEQRNLPHPAQHLVIDRRSGSGLYGPTTAPFCYELRGKGAVLGFKLVPGAATVLFNVRAGDLVDGSVPLTSAGLAAQEVGELEALVEARAFAQAEALLLRLLAQCLEVDMHSLCALAW